MNTIRMGEAHLQAVAALERCCFEEPWSEDALRFLLSEEAMGVVCRSDAGDVLAYGGIVWAPDEGQITNIAVLPSERRRGCGRAVLQALIEQARQRACMHVVLEVRCSNLGAIALYEAFGFVTVGRRKRFYRHPSEDALVLSLPL